MARHKAPPSPRRQLAERIFGISVALAGVVLVAVALIALRHPNGRSAPRSTLSQTGGAADATSGVSKSRSTSPAATTSATKARPAPSKTTSAAPKHQISLIVLSNTGSIDPATTAAARFRSGGWTVASTGLFDGDILSSVAYYDANVSNAQQEALALQRQFPALQRVKERFDGLPEGPIVVVLTSDYS